MKKADLQKLIREEIKSLQRKPLYENKEAMDAMKAAFLPEGDVEAVIEVLANYGVEDSQTLRTMIDEVSVAYKSNNIDDLAIFAIFTSGLVSKLT